MISDVNGVSRELSLHPVHLTPDKEGNLPPSALVPFCSYQGNSNLLGQKLKNATFCDKFKPTILEGQLCYSLDVAKFERKPTKAGKRNGLFLLLDSNPYQVNSNEKKVETERNYHETFKIYIHTLALHTAFGPGTYGMHALKSMTGTESFEELPESQKKCRVHNREKCHTEKFLDLVKRNCSCIPWPLANKDSKEKVISAQSIEPFFNRQTFSVVQRVTLVLQR